MLPRYDQALEIYHRAREYIRAAGLDGEVEWQRRVSFSSFTETEFLRESAWVILCSGFREAIVRRHFNHISLAYCDWESAQSIVDSYPECKFAALGTINHAAKHEAIVSVARAIDKAGFEKFKSGVLADPVNQLVKLPYIGFITSLHLAKNLGMDVAKPDRHLVRVSAKLGFGNAQDFCNYLGKMLNEEVRVVDLVIWRYLADNGRLRRHWC